MVNVVSILGLSIVASYWH